MYCFEFYVVILDDCQSCCAKYMDSYRGPFSLLSNGYWGVFFTSVKKLGNEVEFSMPSRAKVKNEGKYTSSPLYAFIACTGMYIQ